MPRRIDIELTSALSDGSYTWRAAGAREPKGTLAGSILPPGASVGDELKVEIDQMIDGIEVLSVVKEREKPAPDRLELLPSDKPFEAVIETRAKRDRGAGRDRRDDRRPRGRDGEGRDGRGGKPRDGDSRSRDGKRRDGDSRDGRSRDRGARDGEGGRGRRDRPRFDPPPEVPQRPKPKRLRPGTAHRDEVLAALPEEQRPIAEVALQGMAAVRTRLAEENEKLVAAGKAVMPEASVTKMAEELLPKLRVADWLDRADAALRQIEHLDLRDLRSVVAASADSIVARDESTRAVAEEVREALVRKQAEELRLWLEDVDAALGVGRAIRALRLSSQPPKAGVMFPPDLARRLADAATKSLQPEDSPDRWAAVMEAAAFSPVRSLIAPTQPPSEITDELRKTTLRLGPLLPQIAALLGVEVPPNAPKPKPLRPQHRRDSKERADKGGKRHDRSSSGKPAGKDNERRPRRPKPAPEPQATSDTATATEAASKTEAAPPPADSPPATPDAPTDTTTDAASEAAPPPADSPPATPDAPTDTDAEAAPPPADSPPATPDAPTDTETHTETDGSIEPATDDRAG